MSSNPLNDISAVYMKEVLEPQLGKKAPKPMGAKKVEKGKDDAESTAKRVRQAVYDIRYRARREDVKLDQAYNQYMSHTTMTGPEKAAVKEKLGLTTGPVSEETDKKEGKFKVRVTDKSTGKSYVRYATREKITQLRANPNIRSVEMTSYGQPYEGEKTKGEYTAKAKAGKGLDPVGREDKDIDNDGDHDKTDKYLLNRRKVRGAAIAKKSSNVKEEFSNWREDLREVLDASKNSSKDNNRTITGKGAKTKIIINPTLPEAVQNLGGELIEMSEIEGQQLDEISANLALTASQKADEMRRKAAIDGDTETASKKAAQASRLYKGVGPRRAKERLAANEEIELDERKMTPGEKAKEEKIGKKTKKKALPAMKAEYGEKKGTQVYYAWKRKQAMQEDLQPTTPEQFAAQRQLTTAQKKLTAANQSALQQQKKKPVGQQDQSQQTTMKPLAASFELDGGQINERRRVEKGTPRGPEPSAAFKQVSTSMGSSRLGVQPRGQTRLQRQNAERTTNPETGKPERKRPVGSGPTPAQTVAKRRAAAKAAQEFMSDTRGT